MFRAYSGFVWRVLLRLGVAEADVDDVAQEVFLGVHRNLPRCEGRCALGSWLYGICHRRAVDYRRRASARPALAPESWEHQGTDASQEHDLAMSEARNYLQRFLRDLEEDKRTVFLLFDIEGMPMEEVALAVGCSLQTAYSRLYAARRMLDALLTRLQLRGSFVSSGAKAPLESRPKLAGAKEVAHLDRASGGGLKRLSRPRKRRRGLTHRDNAHVLRAGASASGR